ncbi:MAG: glycosyltransferase [Pseudomonadota bacterium]
MKFSIVMPMLNGQRFVAAALDSILVQSHKDFEVIVMDGGSSDGSLETARAYAERDARIAVFSEPDAGIYDAVFNGFERANGDWLAWLNTDDLYTSWSLAAVAAHARAHPACTWLTGYPAAWDGNGRLRYARPTGLYPQRLIKAGWFHSRLLGCIQQESTFFARRFFDQLSEDERKTIRAMRYAGDFALWRAFAHHAPLDVTPTVLAGFRRHGANLSLMDDGGAYEREAHAAGAFSPPAPIAGLLALAYRMAASWAMMRAAARADDAFAQELTASKPP